MKYLLFTLLVVATAALWGFNAGSLAHSVEEAPTLRDLYSKYNHFKMYEDGSYEAETIGGYKVTGCIENAKCQEARDE